MKGSLDLREAADTPHPQDIASCSGKGSERWVRNSPEGRQNKWHLEKKWAKRRSLLQSRVALCLVSFTAFINTQGMKYRWHKAIRHL